MTKSNGEYEITIQTDDIAFVRSVPITFKFSLAVDTPMSGLTFPHGGSTDIIVTLVEATPAQCGTVLTYSYDPDRADTCEMTAVTTTNGIEGSPVITAENNEVCCIEGISTSDQSLMNACVISSQTFLYDVASSTCTVDT